LRVENGLYEDEIKIIIGCGGEWSEKKEERRREIQCQGSGEGHACTWQRTCPWPRGIGGGSTRGQRNWRQCDKPNQSIGISLSLRRAQNLLRSTTHPSSSSCSCSCSCVSLRYARLNWMRWQSNEMIGLFASNIRSLFAHVDLLPGSHFFSLLFSFFLFSTAHDLHLFSHH